MLNVKCIIGKKIIKVIYSEVNHHTGKFHFTGFDTFDHSINIQMENGYWWNLAWKDDEYFELGQGQFRQNKHIELCEIKCWEATKRWEKVINQNIARMNLIYIDEANLIIEKVILEFENGNNINILIASELNKNGKITYPLEYQFDGEIYVIHHEELIKTDKYFNL